MSFPRYPAYKDSGVEWLREVPQDWQVKKFRHLFRESIEKIELEIVGSMLSVSGYRGVEVKEYDDDNRRRLDEDLLGYRIARVGQLVVNTMWLNYAGLGVTEYEGHVSPAYRSYDIAEGLERRYVHHLLRSGIYVQGYTQLLTGIRPNSLQMSRDDLMEFPVLVPSSREQLLIAAFLDCETAKIDALVAEQRRLIDLLAEKRKAVISHAVTKGLNPDAPMKPSGVEWLGDVPAHWELKSLRHSITKIEQGWSPTCENEPAAEDDWGVLKVGCGNRDEFDPTEQKALPRDVDPLTAYEIRTGDILMSRGNTRSLVGMATFVPRVRPRLLLSDLLYRFRAKPELAEGKFLVLCLRSLNARFQIEREATGTSPSMKKIGQGVIRGLFIAMPPFDEQREIVTFIHAETARFDALTAEAQRAIDLLQERRDALISAAVTGQIDVRGLVETVAA